MAIDLEHCQPRGRNNADGLRKRERLAVRDVDIHASVQVGDGQIITPAPRIRLRRRGRAGREGLRFKRSQRECACVGGEGVCAVERKRKSMDIFVRACR